MKLDASTAVIDNDFVGHLIECKLADETLVDALRIILSDLGLSVVVHPLVYDKEVQKEKDRVKLFLREGIFAVASFADILAGDPNREAYYLYLVNELYYSLMGEPLNVNKDTVYSFWVRKKSLGEVHSVSMCLVCCCGIFLSDDGDSKRLQDYIKRMSMGSIEVYNRSELVDRHITEGCTAIPRKTRQSLTHASN